MINTISPYSGSLFHRSQKQKNPASKTGFLLSSDNQKRSIVVMMLLLNDHDLGIVIAPAIVMTARPPTMKTAIKMAVLEQGA